MFACTAGRMHGLPLPVPLDLRGPCGRDARAPRLGVARPRNHEAATFTNFPGTRFTVLTTTNLTLPLTNWTVLGATTEAAPGQFQFLDQTASNASVRYYRVRSP